MFGVEHFWLTDDLRLLVYVEAIVSVAIALAGVYKRYKLWAAGGERVPIGSISLSRVIRYSLFQARLLKDFWGLVHTFVFVGFLILFAGTVLRALEYDVFIEVLGTRYLSGHIWAAFKVAMNAAGFTALIGLTLMIARRALPDRPTRDASLDKGALLWLWAIIFTGFLLNGATYLGYRSDVPWFIDPGGAVFSSLFGAAIAAPQVYRLLWVLHLTLALSLVALSPYTKLLHIVTAGLLNTGLSRQDQSLVHRPIPELERKFERAEPIGMIKLGDSTWKQRLDLDSCTKCMRCEKACPANMAGRPLNPMDLILSLRKLMDGAKFNDEVCPGELDPESVWSCVTCGACVHKCPVLIHHVEIIGDVRRGLISRAANTPDELLQVSYNVMRMGNPLGANPYDREMWVNEVAKELGVKVAKPGEDYDFLYWIGCTISYDPGLRRVAESLMRILKAAGVNFAVIADETCCGEPVRRIGDEYMFYEVVRSVKDILSKYSFRRILVSCPHCYHSLSKDYRQFGVDYDVVHYVQLLSDLVERGVLKLGKGRAKVTYHDPCYLARWNFITREPRALILATGAELVEMSRNRENALCCGGGGGHAYFEIKKGVRISKMRYEEAEGTGAGVLVVACPICNTMFSAEEGRLQIKDLAELLADSLEV